MGSKTAATARSHRSASTEKAAAVSTPAPRDLEMRADRSSPVLASLRGVLGDVEASAASDPRRCLRRPHHKPGPIVLTQRLDRRSINPRSSPANAWRSGSGPALSKRPWSTRPFVGPLRVRRQTGSRRRARATTSCTAILVSTVENIARSRELVEVPVRSRRPTASRLGVRIVPAIARATRYRRWCPTPSEPRTAWSRRRARAAVPRHPGWEGTSRRAR